MAPSGSLRDRLVMLGEPNGPTAEAYRELRTNLRFAPEADDRAGGGRVYLLADGGGSAITRWSPATSALPVRWPGSASLSSMPTCAGRRMRAA